jgi:hypothetical protein
MKPEALIFELKPFENLLFEYGSLKILFFHQNLKFFIWLESQNSEDSKSVFGFAIRAKMAILAFFLDSKFFVFE